MNKSYLKWSGGKSRIIKHVVDAIGNCKNKTFVEPFVGSGTVSLNVDAKEYILNDMNSRLIRTHKEVIYNTHKTINLCETLFDFGVDIYNRVRENFNNPNFYENKESHHIASMFIYLNKHCFNGMFRVNKSNEFNVPVNRNASPNVPIKEMFEFGEYFKNNVKLYNMDFYDVMDDCDNSIIYVDSPYPSASESGSEIRYEANGFTKDDHIRLHEAVVQASKRGNRVVVSYCDIPFIRELYSDADEIREIQAGRSISSKSSTRGKAKELIIIYEGEHNV